MNFMESATTRDITLTLQDAVNPILALPPADRTFGAGPRLEHGRVRLRFGERPIVRDLRSVYRKSGKTLPPDYQVFSAYDIWTILFAVGIVRESGMREVDRFGVSVEFADTPRVTVLNVLPQTRFVKRAGATLKAEATIALNGSAQIPEAINDALAHIDGLSADASLRVATEATLFGTLSFSVLTSIVQAIGTGGRRAEWVFEKCEQPLVGDQHLALTLLTPRSVDQLEITARLFASISVFNFLPCNLETEFPLTLQLQS